MKWVRASCWCHCCYESLSSVIIGCLYSDSLWAILQCRSSEGCKQASKQAGDRMPCAVWKETDWEPGSVLFPQRIDIAILIVWYINIYLYRYILPLPCIIGSLPKWKFVKQLSQSSVEKQNTVQAEHCPYNRTATSQLLPSSRSAETLHLMSFSESL